VAVLDTALAAIKKTLSDLSLGDETLLVSVALVSKERLSGSSVPGPSTRPSTGPSIERNVRVCKTEQLGEERYVLGVVLEPDTVDSQGDIYSAETVRQTAYKFMEEYENIGLQHSGLINDKVKILESWIQRDDSNIGGQLVKAGTWMLAVRVLDDELWAAVKDGRITGFSIGGTGKRLPLVTSSMA
jgi:DNA adenine methylase